MRVAVLIAGAHKGLQPVKVAAFLTALAAEMGDVLVRSVEPTRRDQILVGLRRFSQHRARFRSRFHANSSRFDGRNKSVGRLAFAQTGHIDAILQIGTTFDARQAAEKWPLVIYTDYSVALTRSRVRNEMRWPLWPVCSSWTLIFGDAARALRRNGSRTMSQTAVARRIAHARRVAVTARKI